MLLIPLLVVFFFLDMPYNRVICGWIFAIASITDWLDGYLARKWNQTSKMGAFLDPVADKLLVATALILLVSDAVPDWRVVITLCAIIIIGREIAVSALREWMAQLGKSDAVKVKGVGKAKTFAQMGALAFMLYRDPFFLFSLPSYALGFFLLIAATVLTLISLFVYFKAAITEIQS